jgi:hypothetical protein
VVVMLPARLRTGEMERMNCFMDARIVKPGRMNSRKLSPADLNFAFSAHCQPHRFSLASPVYGF